MAAIEILGLEKTYRVGFWHKRPKIALRPLHLTVEEGEIFGFLGPNGAGKTTTLKLLMGLVYPTAGTARILGMRNQRSSYEGADRLSARATLFLRLSDRRRTARILRSAFRRRCERTSPKVSQVLNQVGLPDSAATDSASSPKECCSALELLKPLCMNPRSCSSMNPCPASIPSAVVMCAI